jgi:hypothetical protein
MRGEPGPQEIVCRLSRRSWAASNHPPPSRRRDRITSKRADQFARNEAHRRRLPANAVPCQSTETPQESNESGYFTADRFSAPVAKLKRCRGTRFKTMEDQSSRSLHSLQVRAIPARPRRLRAGTVSSPISGLAR